MATVCIKNSVALFSPVAVSQKLAARVASLLETTVDANDRLPHHLCKPCKRRFDTLEKAAEDLKSFRTEASECRRSLLARSVSGKRTKESSGSIGISPDTMKERPHPKDIKCSPEDSLTLVKVKKHCAIDLIMYKL